MKPGLYYSLDEATYRAADAVSQSSLKAISRSPAHYLAGVEEDDDEETKFMIRGRVVAVLVLEPTRKPFWRVQPDGIQLNTTEGKEWAKQECEWDESKDGKFPRSAKKAFEQRCLTVISGKEYAHASRMATVLQDCKKPEVRELLDGAKCEVSGFADVETPSGEVLCKFRPDLVPAIPDVLADLKCVQDSRAKPFLHNCVLSRGYYIQAASYIGLWNTIAEADIRRQFAFLAIESSPPYAPVVHYLDAPFLQAGADEYLMMLNTYALCKKLGEWPDYPEGKSILSLPDRMKSQIV